MDLPRFVADELNAELARDNDPGDLFQRVAHELLRSEYPGLHLYATGGKDGGIDSIQVAMGRRVVVESKYVGTRGLQSAMPRWREVEKHLSTHLAAPNGPTTGQSQYAPWYEVETPITEYVFCLSSELEHEGARSKLADNIRTMFRLLAERHQHLQHLKAIAVRVLDGSDFASRLNDAPHLLFSFFPRACPRGFAPLEEQVAPATFRAYLDGNTMAYYSRREHIVACPPPRGEEILDEDGLLDVLGPRETGLIITGGGGHGKTRLLLELGRKARKRGWLVLRMLPRAPTTALEHLARRLSPATPTLLLVDYVETQRGYNDLIETLNSLADDPGLPVRYAASCRTSFYSAIEATGRHRRVDLAPPRGSGGSHYEEERRRLTVKFILARAGLTDSDQAATMCGTTPVLAVFVAWLVARGRDGDLRELLTQNEFGAWLRARVRHSFASHDEVALSRDLATTMALFPLADGAVQRLDDRAAALVEVLATDGWIERVDNEGDIRWQVAHDVFADRVILSHLESYRATLPRFLRHLLDRAAEAGALRSALLALQRVADRLVEVDWAALLREFISDHLDAAREVRDLLLQTSLIEPTDTIQLLRDFPPLWEGAEYEVEFQNRIGWLARWASWPENSDIDPRLRTDLVGWVSRTAPYVGRSNFLLTTGLYLERDALRAAARAWIVNRSPMFQTHYLIRAWLRTGLPTDEISRPVTAWCERFGSAAHFSFVAEAWLDAGGALDLLQSWLEPWLRLHGESIGARYVYPAWLNAGGDKTTVREFIAVWLERHASDRTATFVYQAWLNSGGDPDFLAAPIARWLEQHELVPTADHRFVQWLRAGGERGVVAPSLARWLARNASNYQVGWLYNAWLDAGGEIEFVRTQAVSWLHEHWENDGAAYLIRRLAKIEHLPAEVVREVLRCCARFPDHPDAFWRWTKLRGHLLRPEVAEDVLEAGEAVSAKVLADPSPSATSCLHMTTLCSRVPYATALSNGPLAARADRLIVAWLQHPASFHLGAKAPRVFQQRGLVTRVERLVTELTLDLTRRQDLDGLTRFLHWVATWDDDIKDDVRESLDTLARSYATARRRAGRPIRDAAPDMQHSDPPPTPIPVPDATPRSDSEA